MKLFYLKLVIISILLTTRVIAEKRVDIGLFSKKDLRGWKQEIFSGETRYSVESKGDGSILAADSQHSASAFYREIRVDLEQTPILNWSWFKQQVVNPGNEQDRAGDDFVARVYVIKDGGLLFWRTLAINYVWSYQHTTGESWDNPFAGGRSKMVSLRDARSPEKKWYLEKRNVLKDFEVLHGRKISHIDGVAIMTDSDNSRLSAKARYGDIYFTAE